MSRYCVVDHMSVIVTGVHSIVHITHTCIIPQGKVETLHNAIMECYRPGLLPMKQTVAIAFTLQSCDLKGPHWLEVT